MLHRYECTAGLHMPGSVALADTLAWILVQINSVCSLSFMQILLLLHAAADAALKCLASLQGKT